MKLRNVYYLEDDDFDEKGQFLHSGNWVLFVYGDFCPHCSSVKPVYQELAGELGRKNSLNFAVIQLDGARPSEAKLAARVRDVVSPFAYRGVPAIVYIKDKRVIKEYNGNRSKEDIKKFILK